MSNHLVKSITPVLLLLVFALTVNSVRADSVEKAFAFGEASYQEGSYPEAIAYFGKVLSADQPVDDNIRFQALLYQGDALRILGNNRQAYNALKKAEAMLKKPEVAPSRFNTTLLLSRLGVLEMSRGRGDKAVPLLEEVVSSLDASSLDAGFNSNAHADLGLAYATTGQYADAIEELKRAEHYAVTAGDALQTANVRLNILKVYIEAGELGSSEEAQSSAEEAVENLPNGIEKADRLIALGNMTYQAKQSFDLGAEYRLKVFRYYERSLKMAEADKHSSVKAYAYGGMGRLYEDEGRHEPAVRYSRSAVFHAQSLDMPEALYQWEWQVARNLRALNDIPGARQAYSQAINTLREVRPDFESVARDAYKRYVGPVLYQYADVMLQEASAMGEGPDKQELLVSVRDILEEVKLAEVQDYFESSCLPLRKAGKKLDNLGEHTAVLYPVLLEDRTELLLSLPDGMHQYSSAVDRNTLTQQIREFRVNVQTDLGTRDYIRLAEKLYGWLIRPMEVDLDANAIKTLVIVPDGPLRTIPISALHDGTRYVVEKYAVATTPGLTLTEPRPIDDVEMSVLAAGVTESVQGFSALPSVGKELSMISEKTGATVYKNNAFKLSTVRDQMEQGGYAIAHFATHGEFAGNYKQSFILAHDEKFTMDLLSETISVGQVQSEPIEMLVLSACQTAAGDDRAALGLAGVAVKAGARSALATLWSISDEATAVLISEFYAALLDEKSMSKADSLRYAQVSLIEQQKFRHPSNWAPFLLIGNWL